MKRLRVFVVSDSVGETGDQVAKAVISQFRPGLENTVIRRFPHIQSEELIRKIVFLPRNSEHLLFIHLFAKKCGNYYMIYVNKKKFRLWIF